MCRINLESGITTLERAIACTYNPFRYRGYYYDTQTELYYLQSRYYNPSWGRFLNADIYINANGDILGFNMFAYCSNNPVMFTDPTGEGFWSSVWEVVKSVGNKIIEIPTYVVEAFNFEVSIGCGMALEVDLEIVSAGAGVIDNFVTLKKDPGDTSIKIGQQREKFNGINIAGAFFGKGEREFLNFNTSQIEPEIIEPHMDLNVGNSLKFYYGLGITASIGFDYEHLFNKILFG